MPVLVGTRPSEHRSNLAAEFFSIATIRLRSPVSRRRIPSRVLSTPTLPSRLPKSAYCELTVGGDGSNVAARWISATPTILLIRVMTPTSSAALKKCQVLDTRSLDLPTAGNQSRHFSSQGGPATTFSESFAGTTPTARTHGTSQRRHHRPRRPRQDHPG